MRFKRTTKCTKKHERKIKATKDTKDMDIIYKKECYDIIGAALRVYKVLGPGFVEAVYQEALQREFNRRIIPYQREKEINIYYGDEILDIKFRPDFICYDKIIIELKAVTELEDIHRAQILNYLKATHYRLGLLINFGNQNELEFERKIL